MDASKAIRHLPLTSRSTFDAFCERHGLSPYWWTVVAGNGPETPTATDVPASDIEVLPAGGEWEQDDEVVILMVPARAWTDPLWRVVRFGNRHPRP